MDEGAWDININDVFLNWAVTLASLITLFS